MIVGGLFGERAGIVNIGLDGNLLIGAFSAAIISYYTQSAWLGLLGALGAVVALVSRAIKLRWLKKQEQEEKFANMEKELSELREAKRVSEFKAKFIAQGYDEALAEDTAKAMADGDSAKMFANQQKFLDEYEKRVKADALKKTPKPTPGAGGGTGEMDYAKKIEEARTNACKPKRKRRRKKSKGEFLLWQISLL